MLQLAYPEDTRGIPPDTYAWFRSHRWPLGNEQIWIAQYDGSGDWPIAAHYYAIGLFDSATSTPPDELNGHAAAIAIGHLVIRAFGHTINVGTIDTRGRSLAGTLLKVWPASGERIDFPPPVMIKGNDGLRELADSFGDATAFHQGGGG